MFIVSYVVVTVKARLIDFDRHLEEAAMDLGANEWTTFRKVTLPLLAPAILSAALLGFALSIDDFVITYFVAGSTQTFPLFVWGAARVSVPPQVNVVASAIFLVAVAVMIGNVLWGLRTASRRPPRSRSTRRSRCRVSSRSAAPASLTATALDLQRIAKEHLWMHFTRMGGYAQADVPIIVRGDGCYLEDANGKRYLDALAGLFSVNIGYGYGEEIGQAALEQMRELPFYTNWSYAHPRAIELAGEVASLAPGDLNRVFFVSGGSEAVESAWKLARQYYMARGEKRLVRRSTSRRRGTTRSWPRRARRDATRRSPATSRTTARRSARSRSTASRRCAPRSSRSSPRCATCATRTATTGRRRRRRRSSPRFLLDDLEQAILAMDPETVCLVHMEPVQNSGGAFTPPAGYWAGVRALCDEYDILLSADEVITAFGRLGYWFGSERYDIRPDIVTSAKGLSSSYAAIGAVIATDRVMEPFLESTAMWSHGITFGGHPVMCAIALKNIEIMKREGIVEHVREHEDVFRAKLETLLDLPIVGDVRGTGFFYAVELVKDKETRQTFDDDECETLLRGYLSPALFDAGLICRADDRGDPVVQISPPLVAGEAEMDEIVGILGDVLAEAGRRSGV